MLLGAACIVPHSCLPHHLGQHDTGCGTEPETSKSIDVADIMVMVASTSEPMTEAEPLYVPDGAAPAKVCEQEVMSASISVWVRRRRPRAKVVRGFVAPCG